MTFEDDAYLDFLENDHFVKWVFNPDVETNLFWDKWIEDNPDKINAVRIARHFILNTKYKDDYHLKNSDFSRIHENILHFHYKEKIQKEKNNFMKIYWSSAAVILFFVTFTILLQRTPTDMDKNEEIETLVAVKTAQTIKGVKRTIRLPDGTIVKLNSESTLQYPESFSTSKREVFLTGEAFFDVEKDIEKPFLIHSEGFTTEVIGTSFNIQAYPNHTNKISVLTGKVMVHASTGSTEYLSSGQMGVLKDKNSAIEISGFNSLKETGWKDGILLFLNEPLVNVFQELEKWYGVDISVANPKILTEIYKGEFKDESLDNVLNGIGYASGFKFKIENTKVLIYENENYDKKE